MNLVLDKMSRVVVPKALRDRFGLKPGDELEVTLESDGIKLRPVHAEPALTQEDGILLFSGEIPVSAWDVGAFLDQQREQRNRDICGF